MNVIELHFRRMFCSLSRPLIEAKLYNFFIYHKPMYLLVTKLKTVTLSGKGQVNIPHGTLPGSFSDAPSVSTSITDSTSIHNLLLAVIG